MNIERVKKLEEFLSQDPNDPFVIYALATEWINDDIQRSKQYFDQLISEHPDYIGTYYHAAQLYITLGQKDKAKQIFEKGIEVARKTGNHHALRELQNVYNELLYEED